MHRLSRAACHVADFFKRGPVDQIGAEAPERDRGANTALFERRPFRHEDQESGDYFGSEQPSVLLGISRLRKEQIIVGFHHTVSLSRVVTPK